MSLVLDAAWSLKPALPLGNLVLALKTILQMTDAALLTKSYRLHTVASIIHHLPKFPSDSCREAYPVYIANNTSCRRCSISGAVRPLGVSGQVWQQFVLAEL